ncbi:DUF2059 domain-containing protein (plasmid) [Ralstonia sp. 25C]|uniref:DUF2059 domain-containing protein n=1 Tax=Ralstonia sp. 25C TaxID=3447363 RepID=UPI003F74DB1C
MLSTSALADSREEKVQKLMEAQGLVKTFDQALASSREYGRKQANEMMAQMLSGLNPDETFRKRFQEAMELFMNDLQPPWNAQEIVQTWGQVFGAKFTDEELDQLIAFYSSSLGQKEVAASRDAMPVFSRLFQDRYKPIQERAISKFIDRAKLIAQECRCDR